MLACASQLLVIATSNQLVTYTSPASACFPGGTSVAPSTRKHESAAGGDIMQAAGFRHLLHRAQSGDRLAMDQLLGAIRPDLERRARGYMAPNHADGSTSDLVQGVCLRAWQKLDRFHSAADDEQTLAQFRAWMLRILHRL